MSKLIDPIKVVAFDLDGTLIDSMADLAAALNLMLETLDAPQIPEPRVRAMVGNGVDQLVLRGLTASLGGPPSHPAQQSAALTLYRRLYSQSLFRHSKVFPGVVEGLQALANAGLTLCCITNKDSEFTLPILEQAGIARFFAFTLCGDRREDRKPAPTMLLAACSRCGITPAQMLYVGDSSIDVAAARAAGCPVVIVDYEHTPEATGAASAHPDAIVASFTELLNIRLSADRPRDVTNVIRALAMDAVQKANSGHPGMPMGMAEIAEVLWRRHLRHNPGNPHWPDRDRFVVSNGHGSMLLYALLHLSGYDLPMEQLQRFRQMGSKTPGHPEYGLTPGAETTTGPLGQGISNAVGMAVAEKLLAAEFNRPGLDLFAHYTYVFLGDGCLMEGISHEACSLAGTLGLGRLIVFYDDNGISIDGHVEGWFTDDTPKRFEAYGWHVVPNVDGHDREAVDCAIVAAKAVADRPSLICCKTIIGKGAPNKAGTHDSHGAPLGDKEVAAARTELGWQHPPFVVPPDVYDAWDAREAGAVAESDWNTKLGRYARAYPDAARELQRRLKGDLPTDFPAAMERLIAQVREEAQTIASRKASQDVIEALAPSLPELLGGSADLAGSNLTLWSGSRAVGARTAGNYIHYGVREFGMAAIMNGVALHGGFIPYGGTFLTFSDYCRNALRMAALMRIRSIFVFTHDSIGLGEDGPTHQPVEHVASLRLIPNMDLWRPCDTEESVVAWTAALSRHDGPTCLILSRQNLPFQKRSAASAANVARGGYVLSDPVDGRLPKAALIATGSEIGLAVEAQKVLAEAGVAVRVVSMPSTAVFDRQLREYQDSVLPPALPCVAIEAGSTDLWRKYVGRSGEVVGMTTFGESAPAGELFKHFGFTASRVIEAVKTLLEK